MHDSETVTLKRDVEASVVPVGTMVTLQAGEQAHITQSLGGSYTVILNGNMFRIAAKDADALGVEAAAKPAAAAPVAIAPKSKEQLEKEVWDQMRTCYDPEIPVNIVDLGLVYDVQVVPEEGGNGNRVEVKMTLTAPGCGMGGVIAGDAESRIREIPGVTDARVEVVWDPIWNQSMMSDAARLQLGLM